MPREKGVTEPSRCSRRLKKNTSGRRSMYFSTELIHFAPADYCSLVFTAPKPKSRQQKKKSDKADKVLPSQLVCSLNLTKVGKHPDSSAA